jgi:hypothetical protein
MDGHTLWQMLAVAAFATAIVAAFIWQWRRYDPKVRLTPVEFSVMLSFWLMPGFVGGLLAGWLVWSQ